MEQSTPTLLREATKQIRTAVDQAFHENGLDEIRPQEGRLLHYVVQHPNCTSADLQTQHCMAKSSVSESLALLVEKGFIEYVINDENRREKRILVTSKGLAHQKKVEDVLREISVSLLQDVSKEEQERFDNTLRKIIANAERRAHE